MSTFKKTLDKWSRIKDESWSTVESVLDKCGFRQTGSGRNGTHFTYIHPRLQDLLKSIPRDSEYAKRYAPNGQIIVIVHNNRVPRYVLRIVLQALDDIDTYENSIKSR